MERNLTTVQDLAKSSPFSESTIRWWIFNAKTNGMAPACVRIGRRVYIDLDKFNAWIDSQQQAAA